MTHAFPQLIAIVGKTTWQVMNAKKMLRATWENVSELESSEIHEKRLIKDLESGYVEGMRKDGNPDKAFAEAEKVIERTYTSPFMPHAPMEPMNFFADVKNAKPPSAKGVYISKVSISSTMGKGLELDMSALSF